MNKPIFAHVEDGAYYDSDLDMILPCWEVSISGYRTARGKLEQDVTAALRMRPDGSLTLDKSQLVQWEELAARIVLVRPIAG